MDKLKGKKAGASMGTTYAKELKAVGGIEVVEMDTTPLVVQDIKNGRLAAGLFDSSQAAVFVKQNLIGAARSARSCSKRRYLCYCAAEGFQRC